MKKVLNVRNSKKRIIQYTLSMFNTEFLQNKIIKLLQLQNFFVRHFFKLKYFISKKETK